MMHQNNILEFNPLDYHNQRRVEVLYSHFAPVYFSLQVPDSKSILNWIYEYTDSRFFFGQRYVKSTDIGFDYLHCVAFEDESDLTFFSLNLMDLNSR
jgi:hypothetical protein